MESVIALLTLLMIGSFGLVVSSDALCRNAGNVSCLGSKSF